jgi:elongation factor 1 alpha-like protein
MFAKKDHLNVVLLGHVDAGKSTLLGHLLCLRGQVDDATLKQYEN